MTVEPVHSPRGIAPVVCGPVWGREDVIPCVPDPAVQRHGTLASTGGVCCFQV